MINDKYMEKIIVGNWKMNLGVRESVALARAVLHSVRGKETIPKIIICPSFTALSDSHKVVSRSRVAFGAQDLSSEESGAFTGEVSARMLTDLGCSYVIIGHSERRQKLGESDEEINKKIRLALKNKLTPILCIGENTEQRKAGRYLEVIEEQLVNALDGIKLKRGQNLLIAYEPLWAIGTGNEAEPSDVVEVHDIIREKANNFLNAGKNGSVKILYGGSVDKENVYSFLREQSVDGVLVGGASIKVSEFKEIINIASEFLN